MNSCIMLGLTFWTGIDLSAVFKDEDLVANGIERDPHITVLYAEGKELPRTDLSGVMKTILGNSDWEKLLSEFKKQEPLKVIDHFSLGMFEGDGQDFLVLRLQPESFTTDDFIISYGDSGVYEDYNRYQITTENAVTRYFRQLQASKDKDYYDSL